ncbi:hypothetical protein BDN72DRAFT_837917 [Pluteus cervinus]|uniref:Uncharacterized protein n=1 Tax=Pluteus cervinus TaxID=181527 RepID=A0ACD3B0A3_9AGAR|nr:hypothetical protein BDN72DRAFT_837917 [Pluteus cervinus]
MWLGYPHFKQISKFRQSASRAALHAQFKRSGRRGVYTAVNVIALFAKVTANSEPPMWCSWHFQGPAQPLHPHPQAGKELGVLQPRGQSLV